VLLKYLILEKNKMKIKKLTNKGSGIVIFIVIILLLFAVNFIVQIKPEYDKEGKIPLNPYLGDDFLFNKDNKCIQNIFSLYLKEKLMRKRPATIAVIQKTTDKIDISQITPGSDIMLLPYKSLEYTETNINILKHKAKDNNQIMIAPMYKQEPAENIAVVISPKGKLIGEYTQTHNTNPKQQMQLGNNYPVFDTEIGKIAVMLGDDVLFPEVANIYSIKKAELIFVANNMPDNDFKLNLLLRARAADNFVFIASSTRSTTKEIIDKDIEIKNTVILSPFARDISTESNNVFTAPININDIYHECIDNSRKEYHEKRDPLAYRSLCSEKPEIIDNSTSLRLAIIQPEKQATVPTILNFVDIAGKQGSDLVVLPEYSVFYNDYVFNKLRNISKYYKMYIIGPVIRQKRGIKTSSALFFTRKGKIMDRYDKIHIPWSESQPFHKPGSLYSDIVPGDKVFIYDSDFGRIGIIMCNDIYYQELSRVLGIYGVDILAFPTSTSTSTYMPNIRQRARAIDNNYYFASSEYNAKQGQHFPITSKDSKGSNILDTDGEIIDSINLAQTGLLIKDINLTKRSKDIMQYRRPETYSVLCE